MQRRIKGWMSRSKKETLQGEKRQGCKKKKGKMSRINYGKMLRRRKKMSRINYGKMLRRRKKNIKDKLWKDVKDKLWKDVEEKKKNFFTFFSSANI